MIMRKKGSSPYFSRQRDTELYETFLAMVRNSGFINFRDLCQRVVAAPASRYWVSEDQALCVVRKMFAGIPLPANMRLCKRRMYESIYSALQGLMDTTPDLSLEAMVFEVVNSAAPSYFMTPATAEAVIYKVKNERKSRRNLTAK